MKPETMWVGLDVGADTLAACAIDNSGNPIAEKMLANCDNEVARFIDSWKGDLTPVVGLEIGSTSTALARKLRHRGLKVHAFDTRQASKFLAIRRNKTDTNDARGIADLVRLGRGVVSEVRIKSIECQQLRSQLVLRQNLIRQRMTGEGAMRSIFRLNGGMLKRTFSGTGMRQAVQDELARLKAIEGVDLADMVLPVLDICAATRRHLEVTDRKLNKIASRHPVCSRFMTIPGVGFITALSVYTAIEEPTRFAKSADVGAFFGLVPRVRQSGQSSHRDGITRMGNRMTRMHLTTAALILLRLKTADCELKEWGEALAKRTSPTKARTAVARKLAVLMVSMWKSGEDFRPRRANS